MILTKQDRWDADLLQVEEIGRLFHSLSPGDKGTAHKLIGEHVRNRNTFPEDVDVRDQSLVYMLSQYEDIVSAITTAHTTIPLFLELVNNDIALKITSLTYVPDDTNSVLMDLLGLSEALCWQKSDSKKAPPRGKFGAIPYGFHGVPVAGTLTLSIFPRGLEGTLALESISLREFPELTPEYLPQRMYHSGAHKVLFAQNLNPETTSGRLPPDLSRLSVYTRSHYGSLSVHCTACSPVPMLNADSVASTK